MTVTAKKQERIDVFKNTVRHQNKDRILHVSNHFAYMVHDAGLKISEASRDYSMRLKMLEEFQNRYNYDVYHDIWTRNPMLVSDALGSGLYKIDDKANGVNCEDFSFMSPEDYPLFRDDYEKFVWTVMMKNKFVNINDNNYKKRFKDGMKAYDDYNKFVAEALEMMDEKFGTLNILPLAFSLSTYDVIFNNMRGIKGMSTDLRRYKSVLKDVTDTHKMFGLEAFAKAHGIGSRKDEGADIYFPMLGQCILSTKQFEEFVWPSLKQMYEYVVKYDKIVYIFAESENSRFYEFFQEAPKGHFVIHCELDDPVEVSKKLGNNMCVVGTVPTSILGFGTPKECSDYTKKLINDIGRNGAFMLSENKMMTSPIDAKRENLLAVSEAVHNYKL